MSKPNAFPEPDAPPAEHSGQRTARAATSPQRLIAAFRERIDLAERSTRPVRAATLVVGVGCEHGVAVELLARAIAKVLADHALSEADVCSLATSERKRTEPAIGLYASQRGLPVRYFSDIELDAVRDIATPSASVARLVGTRSVSEAAALRAAGARELLVAKTIYREPDSPGAVTVAVARVNAEPAALPT